MIRVLRFILIFCLGFALALLLVVAAVGCGTRKGNEGNGAAGLRAGAETDEAGAAAIKPPLSSVPRAPANKQAVTTQAQPDMQGNGKLDRKSTEPPVEQPIVQLSEGLAVDLGRKIIYISGTVPIDAHDPERTRVFLEWLACSPDSREHESLVLTKVRPSLIHAAALSQGLNAGRPGSWDWRGERIFANPPTGDAVRIYVKALGSDAAAVPIESWVVNSRTGKTLAQELPQAGFVFAGSNVVKKGETEYYDADLTGGVVGLTSFGNELFAFSEMLNPDAGVAEPVWIANRALIPPAGTEVVISVQPATQTGK